MKRKIIKIHEDICNGCGICVDACHERAIEIVDGRAKLVSDIYCDGLGDCLPNCPTGAIEIIEREALEYNDDAVQIRKKEIDTVSELSQWPIQIKLVNTSANYLKGADLLIAADCTAYAYKDFHKRFIKGKITLIGCPKLDDNKYYEEKLTEIFKKNNINSITVVRMEVPCCLGIVKSVQNALLNSGLSIPYNEVVISTKGELL
ncbi:MAG: 4Fe-4S binding protein [Clostridium sp.]|nr:4Fe-4S binding protein [Clostridium sp.]